MKILGIDAGTLFYYTVMISSGYFTFKDIK